MLANKNGIALFVKDLKRESQKNRLDYLLNIHSDSA